MAEKIHQKTIVISPPAFQKLKQDLPAGHHYKIEIAAFNWGGPIYRLVQANEMKDTDLALTDPGSGLTVYVSGDDAEFFEDLEIILADMFSDQVLMVKERF